MFENLHGHWIEIPLGSGLQVEKIIIIVIFYLLFHYDDHDWSNWRPNVDITIEINVLFITVDIFIL